MAIDYPWTEEPNSCGPLLPICLGTESFPRVDFPLESSEPALSQAARKRMLLLKHKRSTVKMSPVC